MILFSGCRGAALTKTDTRWDHAVVIGGSYAGLLTAHALADHFDRVTVLERDQVEVGTEYHAGVPQARHPHLLLAKGAQLLEARFPGLRAELAGLGAPVYDFGTGVRYLVHGGLTPRAELGITMQSVSRATLERVIRRRVLAHRAITLVPGFTVDGLQLETVSRSITGLTGHAHGPDRRPGQQQRIEADLVVDASGRTSRLPEWLAGVGLQQPVEQVVDGRLSYASRFVRLPEDTERDWQLTGSMPFPPDQPRGGLVLALDGGQWVVSVFGSGGELPPTDEDGLRAYAESLPLPEIAKALAVGEPLAPLYRSSGLVNRWRHYHRLARWPDRLLVVGDAFCAFNPIYAQGMTVAALQAELLGALLSTTTTPNRLGRRFQRAAGRLVHTPWSLATGSDRPWSGQPSPLGARLARAYLARVFELMAIDPEVYRRFIAVQNMVAAPATLLAPALVGRVLRQALPRPRRTVLDLLD